MRGFLRNIHIKLWQQLTPSSLSSSSFFQYSACVYVYFITQVVGKRTQNCRSLVFFDRELFPTVVSVIFSSIRWLIEFAELIET